MASDVDVLMRLRGDSTGAVKAFGNATDAAEATNRAVTKLRDNISQNRRMTAGGAGRVAGGGMLGGVEGLLNDLGLGQISNMVSAVRFGGPVGAAAAMWLGAQQGIKALIPGPSAFDPDAATNPEETLRNVREQWGLKGGDLFAGWKQAWKFGPTVRRDNQRAREIKAMEALGSAELSGILPDLNEWELREANRILAQRRGRAEYEKQLTNVTVNTVTAHLNDGESLRAVVQRTQRNNGQTTTMFRQP